MGGKSANKAGYFDKLKGLLEEYQSIFIVSVDNVSSQQMHEIRQSLRGEGVVLMGKNTMVRFHLIDIWVRSWREATLGEGGGIATGFGTSDMGSESLQNVC